MDGEILEKLSELEHVQWCEWADVLSGELASLIEIIEKLDDGSLSDEDEQTILKVRERLERWDKLMIPYSELSEEVKDQDRVYARKTLDIIKNR